MIRLIGFQAKSGTVTNERTGEVIPWSNRLLRCVTDENIQDREYGLKIFEQKLKTSYVISSLNLDENTSEIGVDASLKNLINKFVIFHTGLVNGKLEVNGFSVVEEPTK